MQDHSVKGAKAVISREALQELIDALVAGNYRVLGPRVRDGAIVYDEIAQARDLPAGWTDRQEAGRYHLERREDEALFGFAVGPQSWKQFLHPPIETLWTARQGDDGIFHYDGQARNPEICFHRRARLRASRDRHPGPRLPGGSIS